MPDVVVGVGIGPSPLEVLSHEQVTGTVPMFPRMTLGTPPNLFTFDLNPRWPIIFDNMSILVPQQPPGGNPRYYYMGEAPHPIRFTGAFDGPTALASWGALLALKGSPQQFTYGSIVATVWVENVQILYRWDDRIGYQVTLQPEAVASPVTTTGAAPLPAQAQGQATTPAPSAEVQINEVAYTAVQDDTWTSVSQAKYGSPDFAGALAQDAGMDPTQPIPVGTSLLIPATTADAQALRQTQQAAAAAALPQG